MRQAMSAFTNYFTDIGYELSYPALSQGPEEKYLSLKRQNPSKTSEKWVIFIALQFGRYTFYIPQE